MLHPYGAVAAVIAIRAFRVSPGDQPAFSASLLDE